MYHLCIRIHGKKSSISERYFPKELIAMTSPTGLKPAMCGSQNQSPSQRGQQATIMNTVTGDYLIASDCIIQWQHQKCLLYRMELSSITHNKSNTNVVGIYKAYAMHNIHRKLSVVCYTHECTVHLRHCRFKTIQKFWPCNIHYLLFS